MKSTPELTGCELQLYNWTAVTGLTNHTKVLNAFKTCFIKPVLKTKIKLLALCFLAVN